MRPISFKRRRFRPEIIRHAIWLYAFTLSFRDIEELLAKRGIDASYEPAVVPEVRTVDRGEYPPFAAATEQSLAPG
jgi:transposase-like protein